MIESGNFKAIVLKSSQRRTNMVLLHYKGKNLLFMQFCNVEPLKAGNSG